MSFVIFVASNHWKNVSPFRHGVFGYSGWLASWLEASRPSSVLLFEILPTATTDWFEFVVRRRCRVLSVSTLKKKSAMKCGKRHWRLCLHGLCSLSSLRAFIPVHPHTASLPAAFCSAQIWGRHPRTNIVRSLDELESKKRPGNQLITWAHGYGKP